MITWRGGWQSHLFLLKKGQRAKVCCGPAAAPNGGRGKKKINQVLLFLTSLFLLSCASLGRVCVRNKETEIPAKSKVVLIGENKQSSLLVFKKEAETMHSYKIR